MLLSLGVNLRATQRSVHRRFNFAGRLCVQRCRKPLYNPAMIFQSFQAVVQQLHLPSMMVMSCGIFLATALICLLQAFNSPGFRRSLLYFAAAMTASGLAVVSLAVVPLMDLHALYKISFALASLAFLLVLLAVLRVVRPNFSLNWYLCFCALATAGHILMIDTSALRHWNWFIQVICTVAITVGIFWSPEPISQQLRWLTMLFGIVFIAALAPHFWCMLTNWWSSGMRFVSTEQPADNDTILFPLRVLVWTLVPFVFYAITNAIVYSLIAQRMTRLLNTDELTGAQSRRALFEKAELWFARNDGTVFALLIDVDHFKKINDTHGHLVGDQALKVCSERIREVVRETDCIVSRYGGEEFCVLIKDVAKFDAERIAHRICERVSSEPIHLGSVQICMTVSIGVAGNAHPTSLMSLFACADKLLYEAKEKGRNCVVIGPMPEIKFTV